ncbi:hypothetical protein NM688_g2331 [Phlebia brevispora]|uniref:Uncharacterized protein n=1 Tax=Phlebia brevispora TaxID=194682 RepID=A0ACC1T957_9APHY|nr:hypothetical protein NM688_g2331 [Phlebia brevispora]
MTWRACFPLSASFVRVLGQARASHQVILGDTSPCYQAAARHRGQSLLPCRLSTHDPYAGTLHSYSILDATFFELWFEKVSLCVAEDMEPHLKGKDESIKDLLGNVISALAKKLAREVDLGEMVKVLKNDKRYLMFDHVPEEREQWLRDYLVNLTAPKLSVHVPEA